MRNKKKLIDALRTVFDRWENLLGGMSEKEIIIQSSPGQWSVSAVITHLHAWQQISIAYLDAALHNRDPNFPEWLGGADPFYAEDHVDRFNARIQELNRSQSWSTRHRAWREGFLRFLELAETVPNSMMFDTERHRWLRGHSLAIVLEGSCEHHEHHLNHLRTGLTPDD